MKPGIVLLPPKRKMRRLVIGDIHGRFEALKEVLTNSSFDYRKDLLISLGDICDGGYNTDLVVEELLKIKNLVFVLGNHDEWFLNNLSTGWAEEIWLQQGGANTLKSYGGKVVEADNFSRRSKLDLRGVNVPVTHQDFFNRAVLYYELDDMLFVHGGINPAIPKITSQSKHDLLWDRNLIGFARKKPVPGYKKVFVGHTTTQTFGNLLEVKDCMAPIKFNNLWCLDTGAGWNGKLTIMNLDTEEYWQSKIQTPGRMV